MSKIRSKNTKPEKAVRSILHRMGYRFRLHDKSLPGTPDIVLARYRAVVDVRGCFWHAHGCKVGRKKPASNVDYWQEKFARNIARDRRNAVELKKLGWKLVVVWECELKKPEKLAAKLRRRLG
jgi:DNA mismatch endonuclease (patch repair protein)